MEHTIKRTMLLVPGLILCLVIVFAGVCGAGFIGYGVIQLGFLAPCSNTPISGIFVAIIVGIVIRNTIGVSDVFLKGISFSVKYALRAGIILLGLRLSLLEALNLGAF